MQAKFAESSEIARISAIKMRTLFRFTQKSGEILACSAGVFIGRARMVLIAKAPCWNSQREEEMGRTYRKGYYFYSPQSSSVIESKMAASS